MRLAHAARAPLARRGFSLIELLVVIAIILILLASVVTLGGWAIRRGQAKNTEAVLRMVNDAVLQFNHQAPLKTVRQETGDTRKPWVTYVERYGNYPPDEMEVFTELGLPGSDPGSDNFSLLPGGATLIPQPPYEDMKFYTIGTNAQPEFEHRDLVAMIMAIEELSDEASSILDRVPEKYRLAVRRDATDAPLQYLNRGDPGDTRWNAEEDDDIRLIVDAWQVPIGYFSQRNFFADRSGNNQAFESSNHQNGWSWNEVSSELVRLNGGAPVILSYGPNGREQLSEAGQADGSASNLGSDFEGRDGTEDHRVDNPLNDDNVYADPQLAEVLSRGK